MFIEGIENNIYYLCETYCKRVDEWTLLKVWWFQLVMLDS
jgi:hypothetical protein